MNSKHIQGTSDFFRTMGKSPVVEHMRAAIAKQGRTTVEVAEVLIRYFIYQGAADGTYKTAERTHIGFYSLTFGDRTTIRQYWHFERQEPLTYDQVRSELDMARLVQMDRWFFEEEAQAHAQR